MADPAPNLKDELLNDLGTSFGSPTDRIGSQPAPALPAIPDHALLCCIGRGSYGEVWLARSALGTFRAVKIVRRQAFDSDRPYEREFAGIRRFEPISRSHPSQLNVLHVGRDDSAGLFYYVMELADNAGPADQAPAAAVGSTAPALSPETYVPRTIRSEIQKRGRLPCAECVNIGTALATALDHLHRHGLVHRDIKPSNIIFVNGIPKLADIGLVTGLEATASFVGTEGYVPPEGPGTPQADIFSLGKVLYEMSTGHDRQDYPELPTNLIDVAIAERSALAEFNEVIVKACHPDIRQRYQTAAELHAELALLQSGRSVTRMRAVERRLRLVKGAGAMVTAVALLIGAGWFWQARQTGRIRVLAMEKALLAEENNQRIVRLDIANGTRLLDEGDPSGALLWFADALPRLSNNPEKESIHRIRIQQTLDRIPRLLGVFPHESSVYSAVFSPDGRFIATGTREGNLRVWEAAGGSVVWGPKAMGPGVGFLRFSRDGKRLFASSTIEQWAFNGHVGSRNFYAVLEADSGRELFSSRQAIPGASTNLLCCHFSPDDRWLAIAQTDNRIRVFDLLRGQWLPELTGHQDEVRFLSFSTDGNLLASASLDRTVRFWRLPSGEAVGPVLKHRFPVVRALLTSDAQHVLTASFENPGAFGQATSQAGEGEIQAWEAATGRRLGEPLRRRDWLLMYLNPAQPERYFATDHEYTFTSPGQPLFKLEAGDVQSWDFSGNHRWLAAGEARNAARVFDATTGELLAGPFPHAGEVSAIQFSPDEKRLLTASSDGTARVWDLRNESKESARRVLPAPMQEIDAVTLGIQVGRSPGRTPIFQRDAQGPILFNDQLQEVVRLTPGPKMKLQDMRSSWHSDFWISWCIEPDSGSLILHRLKGKDFSSILIEHPDSVTTFMITRDDRFVITSCRDGFIRFWRTSDGGLEKSVVIPDASNGRVHGICPDGRTAIWAPEELSERPFFRIVDLGSANFVDGPHALPKGAYLGIRYAPDGKQFAIWDFMGAVTVMETRTARVISSGIQHSGNLSWIEWDPDCRRLLTAGQNEEVLVWDVQTGAQLLGPLHTPGAPNRIARWSFDGRFIVTRNEGKRVRVWDASTGEAVTPLLEHSGDVAFAFLTSSNRLITASYPDLLRAWDLKASQLPPKILNDYVSFLASRQLRDSGAFQTLRPDQLASIYRALQDRAPQLLQ